MGLTWRFFTSTLFPHSTMGMFSHTLCMAGAKQGAHGNWMTCKLAQLQPWENTIPGAASAQHPMLRCRPAIPPAAQHPSCRPQNTALPSPFRHLRQHQCTSCPCRLIGPRTGCAFAADAWLLLLQLLCTAGTYCDRQLYAESQHGDDVRFAHISPCMNSHCHNIENPYQLYFAQFGMPWC